MKRIYLFCTKLWVYLTEIPVITIFCLALKFNSHSEETFKFYPLIFASAFFIIFIFVYFFRYVSVSKDEIRCHGVFSSKDNALISENKTLVIALYPNLNMKLELYEDASKNPAFEWMKAGDVAHREVCIFRASAVGGKRSAIKILEYFSLPKEKSAEAMTDGFEFENDCVSIKTVKENEVLKSKINFKINTV